MEFVNLQIKSFNFNKFTRSSCFCFQTAQITQCASRTLHCRSSAFSRHVLSDCLCDTESAKSANPFGDAGF